MLTLSTFKASQAQLEKLRRIATQRGQSKAALLREFIDSLDSLPA